MKKVLNLVNKNESNRKCQNHYYFITILKPFCTSLIKIIDFILFLQNN